MDLDKKINIINQFSYTITNKQMRIPNAGFIDLGQKTYRYLTEKECLLLMGFEEEDYEKLKKIHRKKQHKMSSILYQQAGNSIVVNVLEGILKIIERREKNENQQRKS